ncbi:MAG: NADH-quinone oxidoreductase subunit NuoE [Nitrospiraceae bacterium]|nr:NADH-quinone oxidoreductase subunit NuoE [Nitrospiraceae bacterium]
MLTETERREIEQELKSYGRKRAAGVEALKIVQRHRGWVSDEHLEEVAGILGVTPDELDGTATFYSLVFRREVGRHVILVCDSISCWITGYEDILCRLQNVLGIGLGGTTPDGRFTLLPVCCLGVCEQAPAVLIDGKVHGNLSPEKIESLLEKYE